MIPAPVIPCKTGQLPDNCRPFWQLSGFTRERRTDRFWRKVKKTRDPNACWPWLNGRTGSGYGAHRDADGKTRYAHRIAWELYHGRPVPPFKVVRHLCGNQLCCRPSHLAIGTPAQNSQDMVDQGRHANRKLTFSAVQQIRAMHAKRARQVDIAEQFGVTQHNVWLIVNRRIFRHVPDLEAVPEIGGQL